MTMTTGIYVIRNTKTGRPRDCYVGHASDIATRNRGEVWLLRRNRFENAHLQNAWNRDGENAFVFEILAVCKRDKDELVRLEQYFVDIIRPRYNILRKCVASSLGKKLPRKTVDKLRAQWADPKRRARRVASIRAAMNTPEARRRNSESKKERFADPEKYAQFVAALRTPEASRNYSAAGLKRWAQLTPEERAARGTKISASKMGHGVSSATRAKISAAQAGTHWSITEAVGHAPRYAQRATEREMARWTTSRGGHNAQE